jgi:hypothetical protein
VLNEQARDRLVANIAGHLCNAQEFIQQRAVRNFSQVHADFGKKLTKALAERAAAKAKVRARVCFVSTDSIPNLDIFRTLMHRYKLTLSELWTINIKLQYVRLIRFVTYDDFLHFLAKCIG